MGYDIEVRQLQRQDTAVIRAMCRWDQLGDTLGGVFSEVWSHINTTGARPTGIAFAPIQPRNRRSRRRSGVHGAAPIARGGRVEPGELPVGEAAVCLHVGPYEEVAQAWMAQHQREANGAPWEVYVSPPEEQPPRTEVVFPLRPAE